jgi:hypothetical protein
MTALAHQATEPDHQQPPPYLAGDRVQILYMSERGTVLADAYVTAVSRRADGRFGVNAVMSDARASFHLVPATEDATTIAHTKASE